MPKILIADDHPQNAELLEAHLDGAGYDVRIAVNGDETLRVAREWQPDLVLLDIMMPKLSGFEVCQRLRSDPALATVGILMITALDQPTDVERALDAGTDDFLTKPINKTELLLRVKALLAARAEANPVERGLSYFGRVLQGLGS
jgi:DNA-binding response OmpR family regulator